MEIPVYLLMVLNSEKIKFLKTQKHGGALITLGCINVEGKRTTDGCETFHNQFGSMFYSTHPNIFDFLEKIKCTQTKTYLKIRATKTPVLLINRDREILQKKRELQDQYKNGQLSRVEYVKQMAFKVLPPS